MLSWYESKTQHFLFDTKKEWKQLWCLCGFSNFNMQAFHYSQRSPKLWAKPHHHWPCEKNLLRWLSCILYWYSWQSGRTTCTIPPCNVTGISDQPDQSDDVLRWSKGTSNSLIPQLMRKGLIIIHIPQSLPLHTHRNSRYLDMIQYVQQPQSGCASLRWAKLVSTES